MSKVGNQMKISKMKLKLGISLVLFVMIFSLIALPGSSAWLYPNTTYTGDWYWNVATSYSSSPVRCYSAEGSTHTIDTRIWQEPITNPMTTETRIYVPWGYPVGTDSYVYITWDYEWMDGMLEKHYEHVEHYIRFEGSYYFDLGASVEAPYPYYSWTEANISVYIYYRFGYFNIFLWRWVLIGGMNGYHNFVLT